MAVTGVPHHDRACTVYYWSIGDTMRSAFTPVPLVRYSSFIGERPEGWEAQHAIHWICGSDCEVNKANPGRGQTFASWVNTVSVVFMPEMLIWAK